MKLIIFTIFTIFFINSIVGQYDGSFWWQNKKLIDAASRVREQRMYGNEGVNNSVNGVENRDINDPQVDHDDCTCILRCHCNDKHLDTTVSSKRCGKSTEICCHIIKLPIPFDCGLDIMPETENITFLDLKSSTNLEVNHNWMLRLLNSRREDKCGAALISNKVAVTATHCIVGNPAASSFTVRSVDAQERILVEIIRYPGYYSGGLYNDLSLLKWNLAMDMSQISTIPLPAQHDNFDGQRCTVAGWEQNQQGFFSVNDSKHLKYVTLEIIPARSCETQMQKTRLGKRFRLHQSFICAGGTDGEDTCKGDGGSPLICEKNNSLVLAGLVSWGLDCHRPIPAMYTNVALFSDWIRQKIN